MPNLLRRFVSVLAVILCTGPILQAAIVATSGAVVIVTPPLDIRAGKYESNTEIRAFNEQQNVAIPESGMTVDTDLPGTYSDNADGLHAGIIPGGTRVNSYMIHFDQIGSTGGENQTRLIGTLTFSNDILGVRLSQYTMNVTDTLLGLEATGLLYPQGQNVRGIDLEPGKDIFTISTNLRTITLNLESGTSTDEMRIITAVPEPATSGVLISAAIAGMLGARRRNGGQF